VKTWDVIVIGGGIVGLSLARELRKNGVSVLVIERGEPGHEASSAAGGMLVDCAEETPAKLRELASASAGMYPEFVREVEDESGEAVDLRSHGTLFFPSQNPHETAPDFLPLPATLPELEPALHTPGLSPVFLKERSVCPRAMVRATLKAARHRGVDVSSGTRVVSVEVVEGRVNGVRTDKTSYHAGRVVNCAGAWAGEIALVPVPTRPVKGQMVCFAGPSHDLLRHVVRAPDIYLIPRTDGRLLAGATVEEAGYDKRTVPETILRLRQAAISILPALAEARVLEDWAGLRPGTPDNLPILGATSVSGYYIATGHYRDGILLAPVTARAMAQLIVDGTTDYDLASFSAERFALRAA
jgi:glycine/D-amino acid oxidase-like deaminating enzyme